MPAERGLPGTGHETRSYMLFDRTSGNAVGGYDDVTAAHAALRQAVEDSPGEAETLALIGFDATGMPAGDSVTFADLPPVAVPGPASESRHILVIRFRERENAEQARRQIVWAMERAHLVPFDIELEEVDRG